MIEMKTTTLATLTLALHFCAAAASAQTVAKAEAPGWPKAPQAPAGAPNIVLVLLDDVGFGATATFGGATATPELDKLARSGLRYNAFHVSALCSPTRAALLSGRTDHQIGFGTVADIAAPYPGYNAHWPKSAASIARVLRDNGYSTAAFGKWHNTPYEEISPDGPFERWPTGLGFDYFYGFLAGYDSQWSPRLYRGTIPADPPKSAEQGYHLTSDLVDDAVHWLRRHEAIAPQKPFFLYFAPGATHWPHHVPKDYIAKYRGKFDQGWDRLREETFARQKQLGVIPADAELTPRPAELPAWEQLTPEQRALYARQMEIYSAFLEHTDHEVGRLLETLRNDGIADDTLVLYIAGDNGGSGEGGLEGRDLINADGSIPSALEGLKQAERFGEERFDNHYSAAWAWAGSTPFQWVKQAASHLGGSRDPLIVSWPARIKEKNGLRPQFQHITDIAPTIYEAAGVTFPESVDGVRQVPLEGASFVKSFVDAAAPSTHPRQVFETVGNRGIYKDGWWAGARHEPPWRLQRAAAPLGQHPWELYDLAHDFSQAHDLAAQRPEKLAELVALFETEAKRTQIYPILPERKPLPSPADGRDVFIYRPGADDIPSRIGPKFSGRAHRIVVDLVVPKGGADGVLLADGGDYGGFTLYVKDGLLQYDANSFGQITGHVASKERLPSGKLRVAFEFTPAPNEAPRGPQGFVARGPFAGAGKLFIGETLAGEGRIDNLVLSYNETLDLGRDDGAPVSPAYASPFPYAGEIESVRVELR
jgi:arylsulfatase A-like enzyme